MQLTDEQKQQVSQWIASGAKLSDIQSRLDQELGLRLTYMDVRLLVDDLKLTPLDPVEDTEPEEKADEVGTAPAEMDGAAPDQPTDEVLPPGTGGVTVSVDQLARPGALVSGKVTFSDGVTAEWYLDQMGRLGMVPSQQGYRPPAEDVQAFQLALEKELMNRGF
ncbi:MAG: hypothetical protein EOP84_25545 [Verrucomicrobiaceae bacterium]|nr:MAG: hypothetical protein EOP84_25545 [Verrucomicrobiaceae bacterium]